MQQPKTKIKSKNEKNTVATNQVSLTILKCIRCNDPITKNYKKVYFEDEIYTVHIDCDGRVVLDTCGFSKEAIEKFIPKNDKH